MKVRIESTDPNFRFHLNLDMTNEFNFCVRPNYTAKTLNKLVNRTFRERCPEQFKRLNGRFTKDWTL